MWRATLAIAISTPMLWCLSRKFSPSTANHETSIGLSLARDADCEDRYLWSVIFDVLASHGSNAERVTEGLGDPLPAKFCGIAFLDLCNRMAISGTAVKHAFESPEGHSRLRELLSSNKESESSYAISATAALPFISLQVSAELSAMASAHPDVAVRIENAWAQAKMGREPAVAQLAEFAKSTVRQSPNSLPRRTWARGANSRRGADCGC